MQPNVQQNPILTRLFMNYSLPEAYSRRLVVASLCWNGVLEHTAAHAGYDRIST